MKSVVVGSAARRAMAGLLAFVATTSVLSGQAFPGYQLAPVSDLGSSGVFAGFAVVEQPIDGKAILLGGITGSGAWSPWVQTWDTDSRQWQYVAPQLPYDWVGNERHNAALASNGKIYLGPGNGPGGWGQHGRIIEVDLATGVAIERGWISGGNIWGVALAPAPASRGGVYLFGGWTGGGVGTIRHYDPVTDQFRVVGSLTAARTVGARVTHPNGNIYLFGGNTGSPSVFRAVEVFEPATETLRAIPNPAAFGFNHGTQGWVGADGAIYVWNPVAPYIGSDSGHVVRLDPVTEAMTDLGLPPLAGASPVSAVGDAAHDRAYFLGMVNPGAVWGVSGTVDPEVWQLAPSNQPPVAVCADVVRPAEATCQVAVTAADVDGGSYDPEGSQLSFDLSPAGPYGLGSHAVQLVAEDALGASDQCTATVDVVDVAPPSIASASASPAVLWPPNHRLVAVDVTSSATDGCSGPATCAITGVTSNEPVGGEPDWQLVDADTVLLRAERSAGGSGRTYDLTLACTDQAGNIATQVATVAVPAGPVVLYANQDSFLRQGAADTNEGGNDALRIQSSGKNRAVVGFDLSDVEPTAVASAHLVLSIADLTDNWGTTGRVVSAHRLLEPWSEGNGWTVGGNDRGTGPGVTWSCATDTDIHNQSANCASSWNGGAFAAATAPGVLHTNGMAGDVTFDVTADLVAGGGSGWLLAKDVEGQAGKVFYVSREGAAATGHPELAPRLVIDYQ